MSQFDDYLSFNKPIELSNKQLDNGNIEVTATMQSSVFLGPASKADSHTPSGMTLGDWQKIVNEQVRQSEMFTKSQKAKAAMEAQLQQNTLAGLKSGAVTVSGTQGVVSQIPIKTHILVKTLTAGEFMLPKASLFCYTNSGNYWVDILAHEKWIADEISYQEYQRLTKELT